MPQLAEGHLLLTSLCSAQVCLKPWAWQLYCWTSVQYGVRWVRGFKNFRKHVLLCLQTQVWSLAPTE